MSNDYTSERADFEHLLKAYQSTKCNLPHQAVDMTAAVQEARAEAFIEAAEYLKGAVAELPDWNTADSQAIRMWATAMSGGLKAKARAAREARARDGAA